MFVKAKTLSLVGILGLILALVLVNGVSKSLFSRVYLDLSEDGLYSLSEGSKNILKNLEDPVTLKYYFSKTEGGKYPAIKLYGSRILDLLKQYERSSGGRLKLEIYDPRPDSEEEEWADKYGLQVIPGQSGEKLYLGLAGVNSFGDEESIAAFNFARQEFLEYDITRIVSMLINPKKPVVGVMSPLDIMPGGLAARGQESGWFAFSQLDETTQLRKVPTDAKEIDKDIDLLTLVHPKNLSEETLYAIDQYVMKGGKLLVFEDPYSQADVPENDPQNPMAAMMADHSSSLNKLTAKWGVELQEKKAVGDIQLAAKVDPGDGNIKLFVLWPNLGKNQVNKDDVSTSKLETLIFPWAGKLKLSKVEGVESEILLRTTAQSQLIDEPQYKFNGGDPDGLIRTFTASGEEQVIAVRLKGKLKSNFPDGLKKADGTATENSLKETAGSANIVIVSDVDFLADRFSVQVQRIFGTKIAQLINDNLNFFQNITENLLGSDDLISIRSRGQFARPFKKVEELEIYAQQRWQREEMSLQAELNGANARLTELQSKTASDGGSKQVVNKAILDEIKKFKDRKLQAQEQLRAVRRNLRQDIERLGTMLFLANTFMVPLALILGTLTYSSLKKKK
jgi:ABC-type uncharacterized transport system involved in gliding motility auxiliary subunit